MDTCGILCSSSRTILNLISSVSCYLVLDAYFKLQDKPLGHKVIATLSFADFIFHILQILLIWFDPGYPLTHSFIGTLTNCTVQFCIFWSACMAHIIFYSFNRYDKQEWSDPVALDKYSQKRYLRLIIPCLLLVFILGTLSSIPSEYQITYSLIAYISNGIALGAIVFYYLGAIYLISKFPDMVRQSLKKTTRVLFAYLTVQMAVIAPLIIRNCLFGYYPLWTLKIDYALALLVSAIGAANSQIFFWQKKVESRGQSVWTPETSPYVSLNNLDESL